MAKIEHDKYYTPTHIAKYCVEKTKEVIGIENITEYLEPSAGDGKFLQFLTDKPCLSYDILPECEGITKQDYLKLKLDYKKGRLCIGNPPFGNCGNLVSKFYKKAIKECDFISFILPIGYLKNTASLFEFELIHSEDLQVQNYSNVDVHCCLNIYRKHQFGILHGEKKTLRYVDICQYARNNTPLFEGTYDIAICSFGNGSCGKEIKHKDQYCHEMYFVIDNNYHLKNKIIETIRSIDWKKEYDFVSAAYLSTNKVILTLKKHIPELEVMTTTSNPFSVNNIIKQVTIKKQFKF